MLIRYTIKQEAIQSRMDRFLEDGVHADIPKDDMHADDAEEARTTSGGR